MSAVVPVLGKPLVEPITLAQDDKLPSPDREETQKPKRPVSEPHPKATKRLPVPERERTFRAQLEVRPPSVEVPELPPTAPTRPSSVEQLESHNLHLAIHVPAPLVECEQRMGSTPTPVAVRLGLRRIPGERL